LCGSLLTFYLGLHFVYLSLFCLSLHSLECFLSFSVLHHPSLSRYLSLSLSPFLSLSLYPLSLSGSLGPFLGRVLSSDSFSCLSLCLLSLSVTHTHTHTHTHT